MESTNGELTKSTYEKMMEEFYEENQKKSKKIDEPKETSSSLPLKLLSSVTIDEVVPIAWDLGPPSPKLISRNVSEYEDGSSSKNLLIGGRHISSKAKHPKINIGIQTKPKGKNAAKLDGLLMEAKSSRDASWFDVAAILNYRVTNGETEARVRFSGFDRSHDEWVNIQTSIRERSIPLIESECHLVQQGDLVLCFRKRGHSDLYFDAHIMQIERNLHDIQGCRCRFQVHYDHDNYEEIVDVRKLCRRPSQLEIV